MDRRAQPQTDQLPGAIMNDHLRVFLQDLSMYFGPEGFDLGFQRGVALTQEVLSILGTSTEPMSPREVFERCNPGTWIEILEFFLDSLCRHAPSVSAAPGNDGAVLYEFIKPRLVPISDGPTPGDSK